MRQGKQGKVRGKPEHGELVTGKKEFRQLKARQNGKIGQCFFYLVCFLFFFPAPDHFGDNEQCEHDQYPASVMFHKVRFTFPVIQDVNLILFESESQLFTGETTKAGGELERDGALKRRQPVAAATNPDPERLTPKRDR